MQCADCGRETATTRVVQLCNPCREKREDDHLVKRIEILQLMLQKLAQAQMKVHQQTKNFLTIFPEETIIVKLVRIIDAAEGMCLIADQVASAGSVAFEDDIEKLRALPNLFTDQEISDKMEMREHHPEPEEVSDEAQNEDRVEEDEPVLDRRDSGGSDRDPDGRSSG